ncbi:MAG: hypothetical protein ACFE95_09775 [Candidatus Hodarchaeota archaeon]
MTKEELKRARELETKLDNCQKNAETVIKMQQDAPKDYENMSFCFRACDNYYEFSHSSKRTAEAVVETILTLLYVQTQKELREAQKEFDEFTKQAVGNLYVELSRRNDLQPCFIKCLNIMKNHLKNYLSRGLTK